MDLSRWHRLMASFGVGPNDATFDALRTAYGEKHRHYHTGRHIDACLAHLDDCLAQAQRPREIELALWFHDAVYRPLAGDNERRSADWASRFLLSSAVQGEVVDRVDQLIMATRHDQPTSTSDEALLLDIDLSILGAAPTVYEQFEHAVRREYRWVPWPLYRRKRAAILQGFLQRHTIYRNELFRSVREEQARSNLQRALARLHGEAGA